MIEILRLVKNDSADTENWDAKYYYEKKQSQNRGEPVWEVSFVEPSIDGVKYHRKRNPKNEHEPKRTEKQKGKNKDRKREPEEEILFNGFWLHIRSSIAKPCVFVKYPII